MQNRKRAPCRSLFALAAIFTCLAAAQSPSISERTLFNFNAQGMDGVAPNGLMMDSAGVLYGTANGLGSPEPSGTVFKLTPPGSPTGAWTHTTLHNFNAQSPVGTYPYGGVIFGADGALYGTTILGGTLAQGAAYRLAPPFDGTSAIEVIHTFGMVNDGAAPVAGLTLGSDGTLFGTTSLGGTSDAGTVYQLIPPTAAGGVWTESVIYSFSGIDGELPFAPVINGPNGVLYGTTLEGGSSGLGNVFQLSPPSSSGGSWQYQLLHSFVGGADGAFTDTPVVLSENGLYGSTYTGGSMNFGTIFKLEYTRGEWVEKVIYSFGCCSGPSEPQSALVIGNGGRLFGTTTIGGGSTACVQGCGTAFRLDPPTPGDTWSLVTLHDFSGGGDGAAPLTGIVYGVNGTTIGTTSAGGDPGGYGTVFELKP